MATEEDNNGRNCRNGQTGHGRRQGHGQTPRRNGHHVEAVTLRRSGTRYPTQSELRRAQEKTIYGISGHQMFLRFLCSFILVVLVGLALLVFGISFISQAKKYQEENQSSIPLVFCVLAIVLGILMHLGAIVLAHYMLRNKLWRQLGSRSSPRRRTSSSSNQALRRGDSCSSLGPPDPADAPPLYSVSQQHALAPPTLHFIATNPLLVTRNGSPVSPDVLFVLPSYEDIVNQKVPSSGDYLPPAYCEETNDPIEHSQETDR